MPALHSFTPYLSFGGIILAIITWVRDLTSKIESIRSNHLSHVQQYAEETRTKTAELVAGQERLEKHTEQQSALISEQTKLLVAIKTVLEERR